MKRKGINLPDTIKVISVIGTFNPWKDFETVIKTVSLLPDDYHLFLYGGQHKLEFNNFSSGLPIIKSMQELILSLNIHKRVHFMGFQPSTDDITDANLFSDYIIMPYKEVGETGSAAIGTALELCDNVFMTRNNCSDELTRFTGDAFFTFDMGNYMELYEKIINLPDSDIIYKNREKYIEKYNISNTIQNYIK